MKQLRNPILKYLLVVLFASYYLGGIAFTHTHHIFTYTIIHSHPYLPGSDGLPHHTHSSTALDTIEQLNEALMEVVPFFTLSMMWILLTSFLQPHKYITVLRTIRGSNLRAPPSFI